MKFKIVALCAGVGALMIMGAVTLQPWLSPGGPPSSYVAYTNTTPPPSPTVASAAPPVKATTFVGGDWPGMATGK